MKYSKLVLCFALFIAACVPVHAQDVIRCDIPFSFRAGNQVLPAGTYALSEAFDSNASLWLLRGKEGEKGVVMTNRTESPLVSRNISLVFRRDGSQYSLLEFWTDGASGRAVVQPRVKDIKVAKSQKSERPELVQIAGTR